MNVLVNIVMATYNGEKYIAEQIESLLKQNYKNWTLTLHDDNSSDKTIEIIRTYQQLYPEKIKFIDDEISFGGAKENFSFLLDQLDENVEYLMFCDQDDYWLEDKVFLTLQKMLEVEGENKKSPVLIHTDLKVVNSKLDILSESMIKFQKLNIEYQYKLKKIAMENILTGCTMMLNKALIRHSKNIPKEAKMHDWWIAIMALKYKGVIEFCPHATILYRQHELNTVGSKKVNILYYLKFKFSSIFHSYKLIYIQYKKAEIDIGLFEFIVKKIVMVVKKF